MSAIDLRLGDCLDVLATLDAGSVDAVVTDPPYGLEFMGKEWDRLDGARIREPSDRDRQPGTAHNATTSLVTRNLPDAYVAGPRMQEWHEAWARECLRILKPGGHLLAFGGTRTYHRLAAGVEDAGFEIRDQLAWMFGSGFPKSLDVSKAIDAKLGAEREETGRVLSTTGNRAELPATDEAREWDGWGTALKPGYEPIVLARKPLAGTVAANVMEHGTGALNIDGCRIEFQGEADEAESKGKNRHGDFGSGARGNAVYRADLRDRADSGNYDAPGRWPANVVLDEEAGAMLDRQTGDLGISAGGRINKAPGKNDNTYGGGWQEAIPGDPGYGDSGGASRFFYCAKVGSDERHKGLAVPSLFADDAPDRNTHPTVKPIDLMRWLCRLITPAGGLIVDPFLGSGSTGIAAAAERFRFLGIERDPEYMAIAEARIAHWTALPVKAA